MNRYRREIERHYQVLDTHLVGREYVVGDSFTIADISSWGWLDRISRVFKDIENPFENYPNLQRLFNKLDQQSYRPV
nr:glutathione S-transferase C-terminal domain-containing protein [Providencia burhodogranariea]